jgi:hypothetical protein
LKDLPSTAARGAVPDLFIVGAPKCGTTAMHAYLGRHPDIFMAPFTENNHFAQDLIPLDDPFRSEERYLELFRDAAGRKVIGEKSVYHLYSRVAARLIDRFNPEAKIIIMLRDPVDMLPSYHAQQLYNTDETILRFDEAWRSEKWRRWGLRLPPKKIRVKGKLRYSRIVSYAEQVRRYLDVFRPDRLKIILYDDFKSDTARVYRETLEFLGLEAGFRPEFPVINARKIVPAIAADPAFIRRLKRRFGPEIDELGRLIGRDLAGWKA